LAVAANLARVQRGEKDRRKIATTALLFGSSGVDEAEK